mgnify:FL=1
MFILLQAADPVVVFITVLLTGIFALGGIIGTILLVAAGVVGVIFIILCVMKSITVVTEKQVAVIERLGKFSRVLTPGIHFIVPFIDKPRAFSWRYYISDPMGRTKLVEKANQVRVSLQNEVLDFPRQQVISRDNASIYLDAVLSFKIISPQTMIYNTQNLPRMLSKLLQAELRNVAGKTDIDQLIEDASAMNELIGVMENDTKNWGVQLVFVKVQRVDARDLTDVLAKKKNADLQNQEIIINSKRIKQKMVIESEGYRDSIVKSAEGEAQEMKSRARGQAQAVVNVAQAEAKSIDQIAAGLEGTNIDPAKYLLSLKYVETFRRIFSQSGTKISMLPEETANMQTAFAMGLSTGVQVR